MDRRLARVKFAEIDRELDEKIKHLEDERMSGAIGFEEFFRQRSLICRKAEIEKTKIEMQIKRAYPHDTIRIFSGKL